MKAFIFDDAGTGKTKRSLDLFEDKKHILIVCPANVVETSWLPQIGKWSHGEAITMKQYKRIGWPESKRFLVVSYNSLGKLTEAPKFSLIVDESHYVKNPRSNRSKMVKKLVGYAEDVLMLTGTPVPRSLEDMYGQLQVMFPTRGERVAKFGEAFATLTAFRTHFGKGHTRYFHGQAVTEYSYSEAAADHVSDIIANLVMERRTSDLRLPPPNWYHCGVKSHEEKNAIIQWRNEWKLTEDVFADSASVVANKMAQLDDGFAYDTEKMPYWFGQSKIMGVYSLADKLYTGIDRRPIVVWTRYKAVYDRLLRGGDAMDAKIWLRKPVSNVMLLVANPASMGTGVDGLQHYSHQQIWIDLPWTFADWEQANRRLVRRGSDFDTHGIYILDTDYNRKIWSVIQGRQTLDELIKQEHES